MNPVDYIQSYINEAILEDLFFSGQRNSFFVKSRDLGVEMFRDQSCHDLTCLSQLVSSLTDAVRSSLS